MDIKFEDKTILITDPCYVLKDEDWDKWQDVNDRRSEFKYLRDNVLYDIRTTCGLRNFIATDTGEGDWSNEIHDPNGRTLGDFCADSGMVAVFDYEEALAYNPEIAELGSHTRTILEGFTGTVSIMYDEYTWGKDGKGKSSTATIIGHRQGTLVFTSHFKGF